jgi:ABC-type oligopeptide transport system ATPase subunit
MKVDFLMYQYRKTKKRKSVKKSLNKRYKTIIRENNLRTLYVLSFLLAVLFVFPIVINYLLLMTSLVVVSGIGLVGYVVVNRTIDYRNRPLQQRLLEALPDKGIKYAATAKFLSGGFERQYRVVEQPMKQIEADVVVDAVPTIKQLSLLEAIKQSTADGWILGQNETSYCHINIKDLVHLGLIGKTGSGKTASTALLLMIHALKNGFNVISLDGKSGVDWTRYNSYIEAYSTDYTTFPNQIEQIVSLHDRRMQLIKNADVSNIDELPSKIPHVLVICEEYGNVCQALQAADKSSFNTTISKMSNLMRVSRSTGIHFLLIDQLPNHWDKTIKANLGGIIGYRIKGQLANGFGMYKLGELKPVGQFCYDEGVYDAWFTKAEIGDLLKRIQQRKISLLSEAACAEEIVPITIDAKVDATNNGGIAAPRTVQVQSVQSVQLPKVVSTRTELVNKLTELLNNNQPINDSLCRKLHLELYQKSINGNASKQIVEYVQSKLNLQ